MRCEKFFWGLGEAVLFVFCGLFCFLRLFRVLFDVRLRCAST